MLISQILDNFTKEYPIYKSINFSVDKGRNSENLHPLFIITQYIIDTFIEKGSKRIAVVLPDDECNIIPMILAKYFSNVQSVSGYAGSVLDDIEIGQHVRLGKAVVEFLGFVDEKEKRNLMIHDNRKYIKFRTDRKNPTIISCPINGVHYFFEKTSGAISSWKTWKEALAEAEKELNRDSAIKNLKAKRTALKKTICLLSAKNDFKEFVEKLVINGQNFEDALSYGEVDPETPGMFSLYNKGKLDCLPSLSVTNELNDIYLLLKENDNKEKVFAIYSTIDKFKEVVDNPDTLKKVLKKEVPFIVFMPESGFEDSPLLSDYEFDVWHWKPSTMKSEALLVPEADNTAIKSRPIFGEITAKVNKAAFSEFTREISLSPELKTLTKLIKLLSQQAPDTDNNIKQLIRKVWNLQRKFTWLICEIKDNVKEDIESELLDVTVVWDNQKLFYSGQNIEKTINKILVLFNEVLAKEKSKKLISLESYIRRISGKSKSVCILLPDRYPYYSETYRFFEKIMGDSGICLRPISQFFSEQEENFKEFDYLIAIWFDKDDYIRIKQSYCYNYLVFELYDFENKWRENYIKRFDECISHETIKQSAGSIGFSEAEISEKPFDKVYTEEDEEFEDISDYNLSNKIVKSTFGNSGTDQNAADAIECVPILLSEDKITYFYSTHEVIDVTVLVKGDIDRPVKKKAINLKKGDKILIRQSGKDIIKEKADELMAQSGEGGLREIAEMWIKLLGLYAVDETITDVCASLNREGADCSFQQVRYWLSGETIMPRDKNALVAIGIVAGQIEELKELSNLYLEKIDAVFEAGKRVQSYHQKAGIWLTRALRSKASEIKTIINTNYHGKIDGIGEVAIYTVEDVLDKEIVSRGRINRLEDLY